MMKHPDEASLALFAGGELSLWRRWSIERHIANCDECRRDVSDFAAVREQISVLGDVPEISWDRLAGEMKANIRLGLEAGECVTLPAGPRVFLSLRALAACASLAALLVASVFLEQPAPRLSEVKPSEPVLETSVSGIRFRAGNEGIMLLNPGGRDVNYLATGSSMRAGYVDAETGQVTINNVYYAQ
jgi:anti-sigma factor RsiW